VAEGGGGDGGGRSYETTFPQPLRALAGSLQLLPPRERANASDAADRTAPWNVGVPGDDHTLRRVVLEYGDDADDDGGKTTTTTTTRERQLKKGGRQSNSLSLIGLGRSADASAYFLPELGIALDAGLHVSSLEPKTVLLTHGHRDHIGALPVHASRGALMLVPEPITGLVRKFLIAEAQLNYGDPGQTDEATTEALGMFDIAGVSDGMRILLPKGRYAGSPTPIGVKVISAPHKTGVPSVSYGIFRQKQRLREEYRGMGKSELGALLRAKRGGGDDDGVSLTESYDEGILFYTGDTQITLLRERWREICPAYKYIIHEVTFLGPPSSELDSSARRKGHTHYAQLHPWICAFPDTVFICAHWSLRYDREEVLDFFERNYGGVPRNVVLWL
jgi:ribonuclease Z